MYLVFNWSIGNGLKSNSKPAYKNEVQLLPTVMKYYNYPEYKCKNSSIWSIVTKLFWISSDISLHYSI